MPPVKTVVPPQAVHIYDAYLACLAARGAGNKTFDSGARCFLAASPTRRPGRTCRWPPGWRAPARSCSRC